MPVRLRPRKYWGPVVIKGRARGGVRKHLVSVRHTLVGGKEEQCVERKNRPVRAYLGKCSHHEKDLTRH